MYVNSYIYESNIMYTYANDMFMFGCSDDYYYFTIITTIIAIEKENNPRLTKTKEEFIEIMNNLNLPYPKVSAN